MSGEIMAAIVAQSRQKPAPPPLRRDFRHNRGGKRRAQSRAEPTRYSRIAEISRP
jgi:hypothetical protein